MPKRALDRFRVFVWLRNHQKISGGGSIALAFAIFLKGLDWQIDGAIRTAAVAFTVAWFVFCFGFYVSTFWDRARRRGVFASIVVALGLGGVFYAYLPPQPITVNQVSERIPGPTPTSESPSPAADLRSELRADGNRAIRLFTIRLKLKRQYSIDEIGHFRVMYEVAAVTDKITPEFYLACQDHYDVNSFGDPYTKQFGYRWAVRYREPNDSYKPIKSFNKGKGYGATTGLVPSTDVLEASADLYNQIPSNKTLEDLYGKYLYIFVTESLVDKIGEVSLQVNNWELFSVKADRLVFQSDRPIAPWFIALSKEERAIPWRSVDVKFDEPLPPAVAARFKDQEVGWTWSLDPSGLHPKKMPEPELKIDPFKREN